MGISRTTTAMWGAQQAERYIAFLDEVFNGLACGEAAGQAVDDRPELYVYLARLHHRRNAHGHRIFYRKIKDGIRIIRVLHTAMYWPQHIK
jgi:plasmid stabilization system protein ParE